jgi:hypothetical protein
MAQDDNTAERRFNLAFHAGATFDLLEGLTIGYVTGDPQHPTSCRLPWVAQLLKRFPKDEVRELVLVRCLTRSSGPDETDMMATYQAAFLEDETAWDAFDNYIALLSLFSMIAKTWPERTLERLSAIEAHLGAPMANIISEAAQQTLEETGEEDENLP